MKLSTKVYLKNNQYFKALKAVKVSKPVGELVTASDLVDARWEKLLGITTKEDWDKIKYLDVKEFYFDQNCFAFFGDDIVVAVAPEGFPLEEFEWKSDDEWDGVDDEEEEDELCKVYINNNRYFDTLDSIVFKGSKNDFLKVIWNKLLDIVTDEELQKIKDVKVKRFYFDDECFAFFDDDTVVAVTPEGVDLNKMNRNMRRNII